MKLTVPEQHQLRIARRVLREQHYTAPDGERYSFLGGPSVRECKEIIKRLTGRKA